MKKIFSFIFIFVVSFQISLAETIVRFPASVNHPHSIETLNNKIIAFKVRVSGKEEMSHCDSGTTDQFEQIMSTSSSSSEDEFNFDDDFFASFASELSDVNVIPVGDNTEERFASKLKQMQINACGQYIYTFDKNLTKEEASVCTPKKTTGLIDVLVEETMLREKNGQEPKAFNLNEVRISEVIREAQDIKKHLVAYLQDYRADEDGRRGLLINYLGSVVLPVRDLMVAVRSYLPNESDGARVYRSFLPEFPTELFPEDNLDLRDLITIGPNPSVENYHMRVVELDSYSSKMAFEEAEIISRDVITLMKAPTSRNYVRALKWLTLQMMLSQVAVYDKILGVREPLDIPRSCQSHFNGDLPASLQVKFNEGEGDLFLDNILSGHGLIFSEQNYQFREYYLENVNKDPLTMGYSGLTPFENYKNAKAFTTNGNQSGLPVAIDDISHFDDVFSMKINEAQAVFKGMERETNNVKVTNNGRGTRVQHAPKKEVTYEGSELFQKIVSTPAAYTTYQVVLDDGTIREVDPTRQNLSTYLAELMQRKGALHFTDIFSESLRAKYSKNTIQIEFPALYGSAFWRNWAVTKIYEFAEENKATNSPELRAAVINACLYSNSLTAGDKALCVARAVDKKNPANVTLERIADFLRPLADSGDFIPLRRLEESKVESHWPLFHMLWESLSYTKNVFNFAKPNELDFLSNQMLAGNNWARLRLSYIIALDELENMKKGHEPVYTGRLFRSYTDNTRCFYDNLDSQISKLTAAAKVFAVNRPITPAHGNNVLSRNEVKAFWNSVVEENHESNAQLFPTIASNKRDYYSLLEDLSYQTLLTKGSVDDALRKVGHRADDSASREIDDVLKSSEGQFGSFFLDLYKMRGQTDKQERLFSDFSQVHGIDNVYSVKENFLAMDNNLKRPIYKSMLREAAHKRKLDVLVQLSQFCELEQNDHESFKALFYATSKAQNQLNQMAGLDSVPEDVLEKINSMSSEEWTDMWLGIGAGVLGIGAIIVGTACAGLTGGLCVPLSVVMVGAGLSSIGMQSALITREYDRKQNADFYEAHIKKMEDLGFANIGSHDAVGRSWFWTIFESISIIPLIGVASRSASLGTKLLVVSTQHALRRSGKIAFKEAARTTLVEADVRLAKTVLGFDSLVNDAALRTAAKGSASEVIDDLALRMGTAGVDDQIIKSTMDEYKRIIQLYQRGRISSSVMIKQIAHLMNPFKGILEAASKTAARNFGKVAVTESRQMIDERTAKVVAKYFNNNPKTMLHLIDSYAGKTLDTAVVRMEQKLQNAGAIRQWFMKTRSEHLYKQRNNLVRIKGSLEKLVARNGNLEKFVLDNMDDLTDFFINVPMRKRETPYMIFLLGGPHMGGPLLGKRLPILGDLADGLLARKFFNARARLVYESYKLEARTTLGLSAHVASETSFVSFKAFTKALSEASVEMTEEQSTRMLAKYREFETAVTEKLFKNFTELKPGTSTLRFKGANEVINLDKETLARLLFTPKGTKEEALSQAIWEAIPTDKLFGIKEISDMAHNAMKELANYKNVDEFERFLTALKVLTINKNPAVVDFI